VNDAAEAIAAVKQYVAGGLPRMRRSGRTDASDLVVSLIAVTPFSRTVCAAG